MLTLILLFITLSLRITNQIRFPINKRETTVKPNEPLKPMELPALGRPFGIGDLYDAATDTIFASATFWTSKQLSEVETNTKLMIEERPYTEVYVKAERKVTDKENALNVKAHIALDLQNLKIHVEGSAAYARSDKVKSDTASVSLIFKKHTHTTALSMELLTNTTDETASKVWEWVDNKPDKEKKEPKRQPRATHIVTKILYGGNAIFEFIYKGAGEEHLSKIEGKVKVAINAGTSFKGSLEVSGKLEEEVNNTAEKLIVNFYGDVKPDLNPVSYEDAIKIAGEIPQNITRATAIPLTVWLMPVQLFKDEIVTMIREIKGDILRQVLQLFYNYKEAESMLSSLSESTLAKAMPTFGRHVARMRALISQLKLIMQKQVQPLRELGKINSDADAKLLNLVREVSGVHVAISYENLKKWIQMKKKENKALSDLFKLNVTLATQPGFYERHIFNSKLHYVVGLNFQYYLIEDPYLNLLQETMFNLTNNNLSYALEIANGQLTNNDFVSWTTDVDKRFGPLYRAIQLFKGLADTTQEKQDIVRIVLAEEPIKTTADYKLLIEIYHYGERIYSKPVNDMIELFFNDDTAVASNLDKLISTNYIQWPKYNFLLLRAENSGSFKDFPGLYGLVNGNDTGFEIIPENAYWTRIHPKKLSGNRPMTFIEKTGNLWKVGEVNNGKKEDKSNYTIGDAKHETIPARPYDWKGQFRPQIVKVGI